MCESEENQRGRRNAGMEAIQEGEEKYTTNDQGDEKRSRGRQKEKKKRTADLNATEPVPTIATAAI